MFSGPRSPRHADQFAVEVVDLSRLEARGCGTSFGVAIEAGARVAGQWPTIRRSDKHRDGAVVEQQMARERAGHGPEELGVADVENATRTAAAPSAAPCGRARSTTRRLGSGQMTSAALVAWSR